MTRTPDPRTTLAPFLLAGALLAGSPVLAATSEDPDWPCIQRQVPEISSGMIWAGPPVEELENDWRDDYVVAQLAGTISARRTDIEDAKRQIAEFAESFAENRNTKLTELFAGVLHRINAERGEIIAGIKRYARRQAALAAHIEDLTKKYNAATAPETEIEQAAREDLEQQIVWDSRIFEERERSLVYVCEQPVLLEQRAFALSREIMNFLER